MSFDSGGTFYPFPNKRPDVLLSVVVWRGETECMLLHRTQSLQTPNASMGIKDSSVDIDPRYVFFFFFASPLFPSLVFSSKCLCSQVDSPSLLYVPSFTARYQISFPLPCHFCTTFIMTDSWLPPQYLLAIIKSLVGHWPRLIYSRSVYGLPVDGLMLILSNQSPKLPQSINCVFCRATNHVSTTQQYSLQGCDNFQMTLSEILFLSVCINSFYSIP